MVQSVPQQNSTLNALLLRLEAGEALIPETPENTLEVVGVLKSYGVVLDAYWRNLLYIAEGQFLELFPFFKYFNGDVNLAKLLKHWNHDRINYEFAEYCLKAMVWHGGGGLDPYLESPEFAQYAKSAYTAKVNPMIRGLQGIFPDFLPEQIRVMVYYSALGQFWRVMSPLFLTLSDRYDQGEIKTIAQVVEHIQAGLVAAAAQPFSYAVKIRGEEYVIVPQSAGLTFLADLALPYVEAVFLRSLPFFGTISYNAQAQYISYDQSKFTYGALFADPLPIGGAGIPPTHLMQDMRHYLPDYLRDFYKSSIRSGNDIRVQICQSFQKSMFCVTTSTIRGLAPHPIPTTDPIQQQANRQHFQQWLARLEDSQLLEVNR